MIHDWAFTDSHYILLGNRIKLDILGSLQALSGLHPMISALSVNPSQPSTPIYFLPRDLPDSKNGGVLRGGRGVQCIKAPLQLWAMHVGNAFEERDAKGILHIHLQLSACSYEWFHFHRMFGYDWRNRKLDPSFMNASNHGNYDHRLLSRLFQVSINLDAKGTCRQCSVMDLSDNWNRSADFLAINPAFAGRRNMHIYAAAASGHRRFLPHFPYDSIVKLNTKDGSVTSWTAGCRTFVGEPMFVPRGIEEDDGCILVVEYAVSKQRCYLVVLDAKRIGGSDAVIAKLEVPRNLTFPLGFHGFWAPR